jgi:hypothetical protein
MKCLLMVVVLIDYHNLRAHTKFCVWLIRWNKKGHIFRLYPSIGDAPGGRGGLGGLVTPGGSPLVVGVAARNVDGHVVLKRRDTVED